MSSIIYNDLYNDCYVSLKDTSYDNTNKSYMTDSELLVINFDSVKNKFASLIHISSPSSVDAIYQDGDTYYLIEFKDTTVKEYILHKKLYDTVIIMSYLYNCSINEIKDKCIYIVVYNEEKNQNISSKTYLENSIYFNDIKNFSDNIIAFHLDVYKGYLCKNIYTYTSDEFKIKFVAKYDTA